MTFQLPHSFGEYTLVAIIAQGRWSTYYQAVQRGMERSVIVDIYDPDNSNDVSKNDFLTNAQLRASVNSPLVGAVYEASSREGYTYVTSEFLSGKSLTEIIESGEKLTVRETIAVLSALTQLCLKYQDMNMAFEAIHLDSIYLDDKANVHFFNTAIEGECTKGLLQNQMSLFGKEIAGLLPKGVPGATRLQTLSDWLRYGQNGELLTWENIHDLLQILREQLGLVPKVTTHQYAMQNEYRPRLSQKMWWLFGALAVLLLGIGIFVFVPSKKEPVNVVVEIPLPKPNFSQSNQTDSKMFLTGVGPVLVNSHEVTIESYASFIRHWALLNASARQDLSHEDDPNHDNTDRKPKDWDAYYAVAKNGGMWNGKAISLRSPVFNVSYWDACSYAKWKPVKQGTAHYRLPTKDEWLEIAQNCTSTPKRDDATTIDDYTYDFDPQQNIAGLFYGVMEWTSSVETAPARDMEPPYHVICGVSQGHSSDLPPVDYEKDPNAQKENIGFRLIKPLTNK